jgi:hypothetical protein
MDPQRKRGSYGFQLARKPSRPICNLYSLTKGQSAIRDWFRASHDRTGNLPLVPGIFADQLAPIVHVGGARVGLSERWRRPF